MMKQRSKKQIKNLGHNNPPEDIKNIEFTNSAIEKLKIDDLDFGNKDYLTIPFIVPRGSHLKGLTLAISKATKSKRFMLRFFHPYIIPSLIVMVV